MAGGKWIDGLTPKMAVAKAARLVLKVRLAAVERLLKPAVKEAYEDVEHVHHLRIATRRAAAALRAFAEALPDKPRKAAKRALKAIRQAAGDARDWDVLLETARKRQGLRFLIGHASGRRAAAQAVLAEAVAEFADDLEKQGRELLRHTHKPEKHAADFATFAAAQLRPLLDEFAADVERNASKPNDLHGRRILAKRLRYALEIFIDCVPPIFRERVYPTIDDVQGVLGDAHDATVGLARLEEIGEQLAASLPNEAARLAPALKRLQKSFEARAAAGPKRFAAWRKKWLKLAKEVRDDFS